MLTSKIMKVLIGNGSRDLQCLSLHQKASQAGSISMVGAFGRSTQSQRSYSFSAGIATHTGKAVACLRSLLQLALPTHTSEPIALAIGLVKTGLYSSSHRRRLGNNLYEKLSVTAYNSHRRPIKNWVTSMYKGFGKPL
jgi:hypothetical protein